MPDARLSPRERLVLTAIIELYIATGEPVASQAVARFFADREGLSSATLRNVMAALGEAGLLEQPHTSAGRVPTAAAFRYYVEQITQAGRAAATAHTSGAAPGSVDSPLSEARRGQIEESYTGVASTQRLPGAHVARAGADFERAGRGAGELDRGTGAGAHSFFAAFDGARAGGAGDAGGRGAGSRAGARSPDDAGGTGDGGQLSERELPRLADRAHSRRSGAARGDGARSLSAVADVGGGAVPQGRAGRRRNADRRFLWKESRT